MPPPGRGVESRPGRGVGLGDGDGEGDGDGDGMGDELAPPPFSGQRSTRGAGGRRVPDGLNWPDAIPATPVVNATVREN